MQWGDNIDSLLEIRESTGITPKALESRPVLDDRLSFFYRLFFELHSERNYTPGGSPLPLPISAILQYGQLYTIPLEDIRWMWGVTRIFDKVWLRLAAKKLESETKSPTKAGA